MERDFINMKKIKLLILTLLLTIFSTAALATPQVLLQTSMGDIEIELDSEHAPITTKNFLDYVNSGFYENLTFHRVIPGFMIQGGGADDQLKFKENNPPIKNEADNGLKNDRGTIAMARTSEINSATSQFFINVVNNDFLNYKSPEQYGYAVFGKVTKGMDIVDKIVSIPTKRVGPHQNVPVEPIYIKKAIVIKND
jgi:peptidyl-prolyl cis-trans isomerase A (cyclophilin A)